MTHPGPIRPRVLLVAEGPSELDGALAAFVRRLLDREIDFERQKVSSPIVRIHAGKGAGYTKRALAWIRFAEKNAFDALVLIVDQDGDADRQQQLDAAQGDDHFACPRALGIAIRTFDAWMLADEKALTIVLGFLVDKQKSPEQDAKPKARCENLRDGCNETLSLPEMYSRLSRQIKLELLEAACPKGFGQFAERVRRLLPA